MILGFANFYKRFNKNFSKITISLIFLFQITKLADNNTLSIQTNKKKKNSDVVKIASRAFDNGVSKNNKNIWNIKRLKNSTKLKKLILAKINFFNTNFFIFGVKEVFIYLLKAFTKASIFHYFDLKYYIQIKINALGYIINGILN